MGRRVAAAVTATQTNMWNFSPGVARVPPTFPLPNDDRALLLPDQGFFAIADASGPTYGGWHEPVKVDEILRVAAESWCANSVADVRTAMNVAFRSANAAGWDPHWSQRIVREGQRLTHPASSVTALAVRGRRVVVGQVGLCRAYRSRQDELRLLLKEHSVARAAAERLDDRLRKVFAYAPSRVVGLQEEVAVDVWDDETQDGDVFVLCTDGVWGGVPERRISELCSQHDLQHVADQLVREAVATDRRDSATAIVVRVAAAAD